MVNKLSDCKRRREKRRKTMQVVCVMLAVIELTGMTNRICKKKNTTRRSGWRGRRTMMTISVGLLMSKGDAYTNKCGCPPSSTTCSSPLKLPAQCYCAEESYVTSRTEKTCLQWQKNALELLNVSAYVKTIRKSVNNGRHRG